MPVVINGSTGISGVDGSAGTPAFQGSDTNTGIRFGTDIVSLVTGGSDRLYIDSSGRLGIGTSSPSNTLHCQTTATSSDLVYFYNQGATGSDVLRLNTEGVGSGTTVLDVQSAGTSRLVVLGTGNVGIGTTSPGALLDVARLGAAWTGSAVGSGTALFVHNGNNAITSPAAIQISAGSSSISYLYFGDETSSTVGSIQYGHTDDTLRFIVNTSERARIDSSGRLLVGTSSALNIDGNLGLQSFQVAGLGASVSRFSADAGSPNLTLSKSRNAVTGGNTILQDADGIGTLRFSAADGSSYLTAALIQAFVDGTPGTNDMPGRLVFSTTADGASSPTERMRITSAGNMAFNGTDVTQTNGNVGQIYKFFGAANNICFAYETTGANRYTTHEFRRSGRSTARTSQISIGENASNQGVIEIYSSAANADLSGGVRLENGATSWSSISDIRLKNVVSYFDNALADVSTLDAFRFTWKSDISATPQVGLSAQSVQAVLPEAIASGKFVNAPEDDDTEYLSVRYTEIIPLLVAALQESKERIEALEAEVAALKAQ